ncbi:hypothetical protein BpHYR1_004066 [Brachionus plicatilis]|uniref:Uncharacterized protein n=1 Tax=Brachionus plicatilis TaxID=10195 RepID=A0A3M7T533_BRAPC|nr:hypothetical protein BpHYR1_004066 [Brachionus plicatilis]
MEGLMIKQILGLDKRSRTTNLLYALNIEPVISKIKKLKLNFASRIIGNECTRTKETDRNNGNKLVQELREILGSNEFITQEILIKKVKKIKEEDEIISKNGICETIKFCLENMDERKEQLKLIVKAYSCKTGP